MATGGATTNQQLTEQTSPYFFSGLDEGVFRSVRIESLDQSAPHLESDSATGVRRPSPVALATPERFRA